MLVALLALIQPETPTQQLVDVKLLSTLHQGPAETTDAFFGRIRGFAARLQGVSLESVLLVFELNGMDQERVLGTLGRFTAGDPLVAGAMVDGLESLLRDEETGAYGGTQDSMHPHIS